MTSGLNHVEINVTDLETSIAFWGWLLPELGFETYQSWEQGRSWKCGDAYIVFVQADDAFRYDNLHRKRPGLNHLAFWAKSAQQVRDLPSQLRARGVTVLYEDRLPDGIGTPSDWSVFFEDPDRLKVEVIAPD